MSNFRNTMVAGSTQNPLSERAQHLLKVLVDRYISDGEPVGSRTLSRGSGLDLSPATVRNVMADLEDLGLVVSPHTSAGRIPTAKGYRVFVDSLLRVSPLRPKEVEMLRAKLGIEGEAQELLGSASSLLSEISSMAGVVTLPRREHTILRRVEFISLSRDRVLVILVSKEGEVQNRIIHTTRVYSRAQLESAGNYLTQHYAGQELDMVRLTLLREMEALRKSVAAEMQAVTEIAEKALVTDEARADFLMSGQTNLMEFEELASIERLKELFEAFNQKHDLLHLFDKCVNAEGVQIFIGEESGYDVFDHCSVVTAPYKVEGDTVGVLGIIGPTRMAYQRVIPIVDVTAKLLTAALNNR